MRAEPRPWRPHATRAAVVGGIVVLAIFTGVLVAFPVADLFGGRDRVALSAVLLTTAVALHVFVVLHVLRPRRDDRAVVPAVLAETALWLLLMANGSQWVGVPVLGLSDVLLVTRGRLRLIVAAVTVGVYVALALTAGESWYVVLSFLIASGVLYTQTVLVRAGNELERTRADLARLAVGQERLRLARDLHDTLGHSMSVALLKLDLAARLRDRDPDRAAAELTSVSGVLRSAVADMHAVVENMRDVSLRQEIDSSAGALASAGVAVTVAADTDVGGPLADTLSWVVREAVTNVIQHSYATRCTIGLARVGDRIELTVSNDGVPTRAGARPGGRGITGMTERMDAVGGSLSTVVTADGEFVLRASAVLT